MQWHGLGLISDPKTLTLPFVSSLLRFDLSLTPTHPPRSYLNNSINFYIIHVNVLRNSWIALSRPLSYHLIVLVSSWSQNLHWSVVTCEVYQSLILSFTLRNHHQRYPTGYFVLYMTLCPPVSWFSLPGGHFLGFWTMLLIAWLISVSIMWP